LNFGPIDAIAERSAIVGGSTCPILESVSDTELLCVGVQAPWESNSVDVSISKQRAINFDAFSY